MSKPEGVAGDFLSLFGVMHEKFLRPGEKITRSRMSPAQFHALSILSRKGPLPMSELADELKISKQQSSPLIRKLIAGGQAARKADAHDRRVVRIEITAAGRGAVQELWAEVGRAFAVKLEALPEAELEELEQMIRRIREILQQID